jgi:hypothetical protein
MSFATITLCVASQQVFVVVDFGTDLVWKLLDTPSYIHKISQLLQYSWKLDPAIENKNTIQIIFGDAAYNWKMAHF